MFYGDILFATTRPSLKNIARIDCKDNNLIASTGFCVIRPKANEADKNYIFYFLISDIAQKQIAPHIKGAQYPAISDKVVKTLLIPKKSYKNQVAIAVQMKYKLEKIEKIKQNQASTLSYLEDLKQSLLDVAFKGELV